jgi:FAD/FMN-containing dehydrogenase
MLTDSALQQLRSAAHGPVLTSVDTDYDTTRRIFYAMIDRRPAVIVLATGVGDVVAAVRFAREHALPISVRGGGHRMAGTAVRDDGLMIDLQPMKAIRVDPEHRIAHAEPGLRLGEFDRATQAHGLATTLGIATDTGIAGLRSTQNIEPRPAAAA